MVSSFTLQPQYSNSQSRTTVLVINQVECNVCLLNNIIMICELRAAELQTSRKLWCDSSFTLQPQYSNSESGTTVFIINQVECNVCLLYNIIMICELRAAAELQTSRKLWCHLSPCNRNIQILSQELRYWLSIKSNAMYVSLITSS